MSQHKASLAGPSSAGLTPSLQTLLQKQQEHAGLQALREASGDLLARAEELAKMSNIMADGGEGESALLGCQRLVALELMSWQRSVLSCGIGLTCSLS